MVISVSNQLRQLLIKRIESMQAEERLPTERALAKEYSVSRDTVRRILKEFAMQGLLYSSPRVGYVRLPEPTKEALCTPRLGQNTVGVIMPVTVGLSTFHARLYLGFADGIRAAGYNYVSHGSHSVVEERMMIDDLTKKHILGIAVNFINGSNGDETIELLNKARLPFVALENYPVGSVIPHVVSDEIKCMEMALDYLFARGHRHVAYVTHGAGQCISSIVDRKKGFQQGLAARGVSKAEVDGSVIHTAPERLLGVISNRYKQEQAPTGFCCEGWMAERLIECLYSNGMKVPKDVEIVAVAGEPAGVQVPAIITDTYKIGRVGATQLVNMITSGVSSNVNVKVPPVEALQQAAVSY